MCFDVPKVVRSHDEESQNGQEVKIDILEGYIRTSEWFRVIRVFFGVPESYRNSPEEVMGLIGPCERSGDTGEPHEYILIDCLEYKSWQSLG